MTTELNEQAQRRAEKNNEEPRTMACPVSDTTTYFAPRLRFIRYFISLLTVGMPALSHWLRPAPGDQKLIGGYEYSSTPWHGILRGALGGVEPRVLHPLSPFVSLGAVLSLKDHQQSGEE